MEVEDSSVTNNSIKNEQQTAITTTNGHINVTLTAHATVKHDSEPTAVKFNINKTGGNGTSNSHTARSGGEFVY
jgi:hypothetical protein